MVLQKKGPRRHLNRRSYDYGQIQGIPRPHVCFFVFNMVLGLHWCL